MTLNRYNYQELEDMPTECVGQADNLKLDYGGYRWWLSRCTKEDGELCDHRVTVEQNRGGNWVTVMNYSGETLEVL